MQPVSSTGLARTLTLSVTIRYLLITVLLVLPRVSGASDYLSPGMPADEVVRRLGSPRAPLIVDVRKPAEYAIAHIPGAINIPHIELLERLDEIRHEHGVLIYCFNGSRTREAELVLFENDIDDFYHLEGTFERWLQGSYPIEKGGTKKIGW
jgi:rhodanese-related sulfurtransferase